MKITLDDWQQKFIDTKRDRILCCGRQVGKSVICGMDAGEKAAKSRNKVFLMIAPTERQAYALFDKTLSYLTENFPRMIKKGKDRPTKTRIKLTNGTIIYCLPTGVSGIGIRFLTVHELYVDEASRIPEAVWDAVTPMLLVTGGNTTLLSTPFGAKNRFADIVRNIDNVYSSFTRFAISSEECMKTRKICSTWTELQRDKALERLVVEKKRMTAKAYAQEYEGIIQESLTHLFSEKLIKACMTLKKGFTSLSLRGNMFLGVDVARMGGDETVLFSLKRTTDRRLVQMDMEVYTKTLLTETIRRIKSANQRFNYKRIYIDDGGLGVGVFDPLFEDNETKRKVVPINNASRSIDKEGRQKKLLKEDLYMNLLFLMESGLIELWKDDDLYHSLRSIQADDLDGGGIRIFGDYTHITEALIRACWCMKDKALNMYIY